MNNIEKQRKYHINKLQDEIRSLKTYKRQGEETIDRFKDSEHRNTEFVKNKMKNIEDSINNWNISIYDKEEEILNIRRGEMDAKLINDMKERVEKQKTLKQSHMNKKKNKEEKKKKDKKVITEYAQSMRDMNRKQRYLGNDINRAYHRYMKISSMFPDYLRKNLKNMPNNKGYIWRDMWFMGELPEEPGRPTVMFERKNRDLLIIRESDDYEVRIFEKRGKNRKILTQKIKRNTRNRENSRIKFSRI